MTPKASNDEFSLQRQAAPRRVGWGLIACTWFLLFAGITASVVGAYALKRTIESRGRQQFAFLATDVAERIDASLRRDSDLTAMARSLITLNPGLTNRDLDRWYAGIDGENRYPESVGFQYIQRVAPADLPAFAALVQRDPIPFARGFDDAAIARPASKPEYCFSRYQILRADASELAKSSAGVMAQIDWCATSLSGRLSTAALSGAPVEITLAELVESIGGIVVTQLHLDPAIVEKSTKAFLAENSRSVFMFSPVYRDGVTPRSPDERKAALLGWIGGIFNVGLIVDEAVGEPPAFGAALTREAGPPLRIASAPNRKIEATMHYTSEIDHNGSWTVAVTGNALHAGPSPTSESLIILLAGTLVTVFLFALLRTTATARNRALILVEKRTGQLRHLALHDPLTGLANRALLLDRADRMLARARREHTGIAMLFIDLDDFKDVNDTAGHAAGDSLLTGVATRLKAVLRATDTVGRLGGDEFVVVAENNADDGGPDELARRILKALEEPFHLGETETAYAVSASIGVATGDRPHAQELLREADIALYEAKDAGKNRYVVFERRSRLDEEGVEPRRS